MKVILMRHGQTDWNAEDRYQGHSNESNLTEEGKRQITAILKVLEMHGIAKEIRVVFSSDLKRALHTAEFVSAKLGISFMTEQRLREAHVGKLEGVTKEDAKEKFPEYYKAREQDGHKTPFPGGESYKDCEERIRPFAMRLLKEYPNDTVLIIGHGFINRALIAVLLNVKATDIPAQPNNMARIIEIEKGTLFWPSQNAPTLACQSRGEPKTSTITPQGIAEGFVEE